MSQFSEPVSIGEHIYLARGMVILTRFSPTPLQVGPPRGIPTQPVTVKRGAPDFTCAAGNPAQVVKPMTEIGR